MQISKFDFNNGVYSLEFEKETREGLLTIKMSFQANWAFSLAADNEADDLTRAAAFYIAGPSNVFPYETTSNLLTLPLHIPHLDGRTMFKSCMNMFIKRTNSPVHVGLVEHPGYPLTVISFDTTIISESIIRSVIESIMRGIKGAEITLDKTTEKDVTEEDVLDEIDENKIIEYEEDEELKQLMKEPVDRTIQPLEGVDIYD